MKTQNQQDGAALAPVAGSAKSSRRWRKGHAPKDGKKYEMRRRYRVCPGRSPRCWSYACWAPVAWWNGKTYVEANQLIGGERTLNQPDEWRPLPNAR